MCKDGCDLRNALNLSTVRLRILRMKRMKTYATPHYIENLVSLELNHKNKEGVRVGIEIKQNMDISHTSGLLL